MIFPGQLAIQACVFESVFGERVMTLIGPFEYRDDFLNFGCQRRHELAAASASGFLGLPPHPRQGLSRS